MCVCVCVCARAPHTTMSHAWPRQSKRKVAAMKLFSPSVLARLSKLDGDPSLVRVPVVGGGVTRC